MKTISLTRIKVLVYCIFILALIFTMMSCGTSQKALDRKCARAQAKYEMAAYRFGCNLFTGNDTTDHTITNTIIKDTTIFVPVPGDTKTDTIKVEITNGIVNSEQSKLETKYAFAIAQVIDGVLVLNLYQKESVIAATIAGAIQYRYIEKDRIITAQLPAKVTNELNQWQVLQLWFGRAAMALLFVLLVYKITMFSLKRIV